MDVINVDRFLYREFESAIVVRKDGDDLIMERHRALSPGVVATQMRGRYSRDSITGRHYVPGESEDAFLTDYRRVFVEELPLPNSDHLSDLVIDMAMDAKNKHGCQAMYDARGNEIKKVA